MSYLDPYQAEVYENIEQLRSKITQGLVAQAMAEVQTQIEERVSHIVHEMEPQIARFFDHHRQAVIIQFSIRGDRL